MTQHMAPFSFPSYRMLVRRLGEADAMVELTEIATRYFLEGADASGGAESFVRMQSERYGIRVSWSELALLKSHLARSYIISVHEFAAVFLHDFRAEHVALYEKWKGDSMSKDALTVTLENVCGSVEEGTRRVGADLLMRFQYYRCVRNWIMHEFGSDQEELADRAAGMAAYEPERGQLATLAAPNRPDALTFDDFLLFSRVTRLIAETLCGIAQPTVDHWISRFDTSPFRYLQTNPVRMRNAIAGRIRTDYGMNESDGRWIAQAICDSPA